MAGREFDGQSPHLSDYENSYYLIQERERAMTVTRTLQAGVEQIINEKGGEEEINAFIHENVAGFLDVQNDTLPEGAQSARQASIGLFQKSLDEIRSKANTLLTERTKTETAEAASSTLRSDLLSDEPVDFDSRMRELIPILGPKEARETVTKSVMALALDPENPRPDLLDDLLSATQADGKTPILDAETSMRVSQAYMQAENMADTVEKDRADAVREDTLAEATQMIFDGKDPTEELMKKVKDGTFTHQEAGDIIMLAAKARDQLAGGSVNQANVAKVQRQIIQNPTSVTVQYILEKEREGYFGFGSDAATVANQLISNIVSAQQAARQAAASSGGSGGSGMFSAAREYTQAMTVARNWLFSNYGNYGKHGGDEGLVLVRINTRYTHYLRRGETPERAARLVLGEFPVELYGGGARDGGYGGYTVGASTPTLSPLRANSSNGGGQGRHWTMEGGLN